MRGDWRRPGKIRQYRFMPLNLPLMQNNITRVDLDAVIEFLRGEDPILTQSTNVQSFEEEWSE